MPETKLQFYERGISVGGRSCITMLLTRVDEERMKRWTPKQKKEALAFIDSARTIFNAFENTITKSCAK